MLSRKREDTYAQEHSQLRVTQKRIHATDHSKAMGAGEHERIPSDPDRERGQDISPWVSKG